MKRNTAIILAIIVLAILVGYWVIHTRIVTLGGSQACTLEAKLCPDGTAVGRTGPDCEFAACPPTSSGTTSATTTLSIGMAGMANGTVIGVIDLVEDSRCPVDVLCVQAGTVRVRASIDSYNKAFTFTLGQPQVIGNTTIMLASVIPTQKNSKQTVQSSEYRFTFSVVPNVTATPVPTGVSSSNSGVRGMVLLGPTCPVMRNPPDPQCADKPYATEILVYQSGSNTLRTSGTSNTSGAFEFSLSPGTYRLVAKGGAMLPRCNDTSVTVSPNAYVTTTISCDTGIR